MKSATEEKIFKLLSVHFSIGQEVITLRSNLIEELYMDSIGLLEIVMTLNDVFSVVLPEGG
ncbi:acyl carrier protein [Pseudomonas sp. Z1-29]|uniref:acyl carrier protein n=1 Tax=Pseudomonas sp. Z1-29 TaxID=2817410 RepID=UPI003DA92DC1